MAEDDNVAGPNEGSWDPAAEVIRALERIDLRGGRVEHAPHRFSGVDVMFVPPRGSSGSPIFVIAVEDEIHVMSGAGGRRTINNEDEDDIDHFVAVITALIEGGGRDLSTHDPDHGYQPHLWIGSASFSSGPTDADFLRAIPAW